MSDFTSGSPRAKRQFYSQPEIAKAYDEQRFGGAGGAWVNAREIEITLELVTPFRRALDLGCGTGRLLRELMPRGTAIGIDTSLPMLTLARQPRNSESFSVPGALNQTETRAEPLLAQADAFSIPFADGSFDAVVALRLLFHFASLERLIREMARVATPRGIIVFDTIAWSPRAWLPLDAARWGGGVHVHSTRQIEEIAERLGLKIITRRGAFLFSPYLYRRLPMAIVHTLERIETHVPTRWRSRIFWKLARESS